VVSDKHARRGLNPQTGEDIVIPRRRVVRFEYSRKLKDELNP
jgi:nucleoid DNA-binding protein